MPKHHEPDTKKEIELEAAKIELEKKKADLWKHRFDTYLAIARDLSLIIIIAATTWFNMTSGKAPRALPEMAAAGSGGGEHIMRAMAVTPPILSDYLNVHTGLWFLVIIAVIFLVLPRLKRRRKDDEKGKGTPGQP